MPMKTTVWTRSEWRKRRDAAKVGKSACLRVSVGDELDKFHQANAQSLGKGAKQAMQLKKKLDIYCKSIKSRHSAFEKTVRGDLLKSVDIYIRAAQEMGKVMAAYPNRLENARALWRQIMPAMVERVRAGGDGEFEHPQLKAFETTLLEAGGAARIIAHLDPAFAKHGGALSMAAVWLSDPPTKAMIAGIDKALKMKVPA